MDNFIGEIRMFTCSWATQGWALCNGAALSVQQNAALYSLISTCYGGNGTTVFKLPDLQGRVPLNMGVSPISGTTYKIGVAGGEESVLLTGANLPPHSHKLAANNAIADKYPPAGSTLATPPADVEAVPVTPLIYSKAMPNATLAASSLVSVGANAAHDNMQPFSVINFCIAMQGVYPARN